MQMLDPGRCGRDNGIGPSGVSNARPSYERRGTHRWRTRETRPGHTCTRAEDGVSSTWATHPVVKIRTESAAETNSEVLAREEPQRQATLDPRRPAGGYQEMCALVLLAKP